MTTRAETAAAEDGRNSDAFGVTVWALGPHHFLDATKAEAEALRAAMAVLRDAVAIEQKLDLLLSNLIEFERELADRALAMMYRGFQSVHGLLDDQLAFGQRLLNLLSAARTYVDHVKHHVKRMHPGDPIAVAAVEAAMSQQYDTSFAYRLMEALRNYSQHRGMPLHGFSYDRRWIDEDGGRRMENNVRLSLDAATLAADGGFKATTLNELEAEPKGMDLKRVVREYVGGLATVHGVVRDAIDGVATAAEALVSDWRARYATAAGLGQPPVGLAVVRRSGQGRGTNLTGLADTPIGYLELLRSRTGQIVNLASQSLSTRPLPTKPVPARAP